MLSYIIGKLENIGSITDKIAKLASRHVRYSSEPKHYEPLLWMLAKHLAQNIMELTRYFV